MYFLRTSWSGGRITAKQSNDRGVASQGNSIILRDLTQECRKQSLIDTDITVILFKTFF